MLLRIKVANPVSPEGIGKNPDGVVDKELFTTMM
jgi:hypothetical protein